MDSKELTGFILSNLTMTANEISEILNVPKRKISYTIGALKRCGKISSNTVRP